MLGCKYSSSFWTQMETPIECTKLDMCTWKGGSGQFFGNFFIYTKRVTLFWSASRPQLRWYIIKGSLHKYITLFPSKRDKTWQGSVSWAECDITPTINLLYEFSSCCCQTNQSRNCCWIEYTALPILTELNNLIV